MEIEDTSSGNACFLFGKWIVSRHHHVILNSNFLYPCNPHYYLTLLEVLSIHNPLVVN